MAYDINSALFGLGRKSENFLAVFFWVGLDIWKFLAAILNVSPRAGR
jgi:hypothetical protein